MDPSTIHLLWVYDQTEVTRETTRLLKPFIVVREHFKHSVVVQYEDLWGRTSFL